MTEPTTPSGTDRATPGQLVRAELFRMLGQYMLGALLVGIETPGLMERLRTDHEAFETLGTLAKQEDASTEALVDAARTLATYLDPNMDEQLQGEFAVLLTAAALAGANVSEEA